MEEWKIITNSDHYAISNIGRVKRLERIVWCKVNNGYSVYKEKLLSPSTNNSKGYSRIVINYLDGTKVYEGIHRLVAKEFIPNKDNLPQVNHINGIKTDNRVENLEWCTPSYNTRHSIDVLGIKRWKNGSNCNFAILTEEQVKQIPKLLETLNRAEIAKLFNVASTTITEICNKRSWRHLNLDFPKPKTTSKYKNIFYRADRNIWGYHCVVNKKKIQSCKYKTEEDAFIAYNEFIRVTKI